MFRSRNLRVIIEKNYANPLGSTVIVSINMMAQSGIPCYKETIDVLSVGIVNLSCNLIILIRFRRMCFEVIHKCALTHFLPWSLNILYYKVQTRLLMRLVCPKVPETLFQGIQFCSLLVNVLNEPILNTKVTKVFSIRW